MLLSASPRALSEMNEESPIYTVKLAVNSDSVVVEFSASQDIEALADWIVKEHNLRGGEGCNTDRCVSEALAAVMRDEIATGQGKPPNRLGKINAVYSRSVNKYMAEQEAENKERAEWRRKRRLQTDSTMTYPTGETNFEDENSAILPGNGNYAAIPCVPPFCSFECAAPPLSAVQLDNLAASIISVANITNVVSTNYDSSQHSRPFKFALGDELFGESGWPPAARSCPGNFIQNTSEARYKGRPLFPIRPIWIAIPEERVVACVPRKGTAFANLVRNRTATTSDFAESTESEHLYHRSYRRSYFGTTRKKNGWDALRHVEILAAGTVPWFTDFDNNIEHELDIERLLPPPLVLAHLPMRLLAAYQRKLRHDGIVQPPAKHGSSNGAPGSIDFEVFDKDEYLQIAAALLGYTRRRLTTRTLAKYVLDSSGHGYLYRSATKGNGRVLMLCGHGQADYVRDNLLHGLRRLLGRRFVDFIRPKHLYKSPEFTGLDFSAELPEELATRSHIYGGGFSYALHLTDSLYDSVEDGTTEAAREGDTFSFETRGNFINRDEETLRRQISSGPGTYFDLIIYGSVHRGRPLWSDVLMGGFAPDHVVFIDGEDEFGAWAGNLHSALQQFGHLYVREMPTGCPPPLTCNEDDEACNEVELAGNLLNTEFL